MIQINLLPAKVRKSKDTTRLFILAYTTSLILVGCAIGYLWTSMVSEKDALEQRLAQLDQQVKQYAKFDKMLKELTQKKELIDKKTAIIKDLQKDRDAIVRMLALLSVELPPDKMWFEKLMQSGNVVTLDGAALNNESIVEFMRNLESSPLIEKGSVYLAHSRQSNVGNSKIREFRVSYRFYTYSQLQAKQEKKTP